MMRWVTTRFHGVGIGTVLAFGITSTPLFGCGGAAAGGQDSAHPAGGPSGLPAYVGRATELFDDTIELAAVGNAVDPGTPPLQDARLRERAQTSDAVVRARVVTWTAQDWDGGRGYQLGFHTLGRLAGAGPLDADFALSVASTSPAAGILRAYEDHLVGLTMVVFVRRFVLPGAPDRARWRFHMAPDSAGELEAIRTAVLLDEVR